MKEVLPQKLQIIDNPNSPSSLLNSNIYPINCNSNSAKLGIIRNVLHCKLQSQCDRHKRDQSLFELNILIRQVIRFPIFATQLVPTSERSNLEKPDQEKPGLLNCLGELSEAFSCWLLSHNEIVCLFWMGGSLKC